ncbi:MAG: Rrf2 family transcriptional regulator [Fimbriimonadaceae bacterium]|nr:Rrf2 family transcriptional regulator [Fimbriimonadaceae bacterium]
MKLSAQEEYGLRCLITLASKGRGASMTIPEIGEIEGLSTSHVAKLMGILRRAGVVTSLRGQAGGYQLALEPGEIRIAPVLSDLGGRLYTDGHCDHFSRNVEDCVHGSECTIRVLWATIQGAVDAVLTPLTLADLLPGARTSTVEIYDSVPVEAGHCG